MAKKKEFKGRTKIGFVLDRSGSMNTIKPSVISGFNEWINEQQKVKDDTVMTLTMFDTTYTSHYIDRPIGQVSHLTTTAYRPEIGGMTALYDAIAHCVQQMEIGLGEKDRALMVILTDGQENSSKEFDRVAIKKLIEDHEAKGNWTFTYLSASPTAFEDARDIGTQSGNVAVFAATPQGVAQGFRTTSKSTLSYRGGATGQSMSFYQPEDDEPEEKE